MNRAEFERSHRLFDGSLVEPLNDQKISESLRAHSSMALGNQARLLLLHDGCDLRKPYSKELENLGEVRSLDGKIIPGYSSFNSVVLDEKGKTLRLMEHTFYSNGDPNYVTSQELKDFFKGKLQVSQNPFERKRHEAIETSLLQGSFHSFLTITHHQLQRASESLKGENSEITLVHILDRGHDDEAFFRFIDEDLGDEFVIRARLSRNSNQSRINEKPHKEEFLKLKNVSFAHETVEILPNVIIKNKVYQNLKRVIEWDQLTLAHQSYTVLRIQLFDRKGKSLFKDPMLLLSNIALTKAFQAVVLYCLYLKRAKIEGVFKFLKDVLGWEEFQVREFETIKNLVAFGFFVGGYFYEIESALLQNEHIRWLCHLGGSKGKVTRYFFLEGLKKLLLHHQVEQFFQTNQISEKTLAQMYAIPGLEP